MARRPRHRRKDMRDAMKKKGAGKDKPEAPEPEAPEPEDDEDDVHEAATKEISEERLKKAMDRAAKAAAEAAEAADASEAPTDREEPTDAASPDDSAGDEPRRKKKKRKRRRRAPDRETPEPPAGLAEGFGVVTAVIGGVFSCVSIVILWKVFAEDPKYPAVKPAYWWLVCQGLGASVAYMWLAVSGGGLSGEWRWAKASISATSGFLVALAAVDAFMVLAFAGETPEGTPESTSGVFWAVAWGIFPVICLLFMNVPGLAGDIKQKKPKREQEPEPDDAAPPEADDGDESGDDDTEKEG